MNLIQFRRENVTEVRINEKKVTREKCNQKRIISRLNKRARNLLSICFIFRLCSLYETRNTDCLYLSILSDKV